MGKTDYTVLNLKPAEKITFRTAAFITGIAIGWIFYDSIAAGMATGIIICTFENRYSNFLFEKRKKVMIEQFRDILYSISASVATGRSLGQALEESAVFWKGTYDENDIMMVELRQMIREMKESQTSDIEVMADFAERSGLEDVQDFVMVCRTCKSTGADFEKAVYRASVLIEDKMNLERELDTATAQKKFEGRIVMIMPFALLITIKIISPAYLIPLYTLTAGRIISTISLILLTTGAAVMEGVNKIDI